MLFGTKFQRESHLCRIHHADAFSLVFMLVQLAAKRTCLDCASVGFGKVAERDVLPVAHTPRFSRIAFSALSMITIGLVMIVMVVVIVMALMMIMVMFFAV